MPATLTLSHAPYDHALRALVAAAPVSMKRVLRAEAGSILKACAGRTKVATATAITARERLRIVRDLGLTAGRGSDKSESTVSVNAGIRGDYGKVWQRTLRKRDSRYGKAGSYGWQQTHAANLRPLNRHLGAARWVDVSEAVQDVKYQTNKRVPMARKSAGLARQSWVQIADNLGILLELVPGGGLSAAGLRKAREALTSQGRAVINGFSTEEQRQYGYLLRLTNRLPYGPAAGLDTVLQWVLAGRAAFFQRNLARGVFNDQAKLLRAYPGLAVRER